MLTGKSILVRKRTLAATVLGIGAVLAVTACGPSSTPSASGGPSGSLTTSPSAPSSGAPSSTPGSPPARPVSPPNAGQQPVTTVPGGSPGTGTLVPMPPYASVPASQINETGMTTEQPTAVQTAEGGRIVLFHAEQAGCQAVSARLDSQASNQVVINVVVTSSAGAGKACPMIVRVVPVTVGLSAPLGTRTVVFQETIKH